MEDAKWQRRARLRSAAGDALLNAAVALLVLVALGFVLSFVVEPHGPSNTFIQVAVPVVPPLLYLGVGLLYSLQRIGGRQTAGEESAGVVRVTDAGEYLTRRDWLRLEWPTLWLLGGLLLMLLAVGILAPQRPTPDLPNYDLIDLLRRRAFAVGLLTVLAPAGAALWRLWRGDGTRFEPVAPLPEPKVEPYGFEVVMRRDEDDADPR